MLCRSILSRAFNATLKFGTEAEVLVAKVLEKGEVRSGSCSRKVIMVKTRRVDFRKSLG